MNLVIRAITLNDQPLTQAIDGRFDARGGSIGRSESNTMALPDPQRHISRLQAEVIAEGGRFVIRNAGSANPILVNGHALGPGERAALAHQDELRIGGYVLGVSLGDAGHCGNSGNSREDAHTTAADPFADLLVPPGAAAAPAGVDPFAFLSSGDAFGAAPAPPPPPATATAADTAAPWPIEGPRAAPPPARLPDDFDPFADLAPTPDAAPEPAAATNASATRDLLASVGASSGQAATVDSLFGIDAVPQGSDDALAAFLRGAPAPAAQSAPQQHDEIGTDPLALFGAAAPRVRPASGRAAAFDHTPELAGAYTPPRILEPEPRIAPLPAPLPAPPPAAPRRAEPLAAPRSAAAADAVALWAAFCEGAGVKPSLAHADAAQMRVLGQVMREAIDGTVRLMAIRATAKQELRAAVTTIRGRNNNPLKFAPDAQVATEQLMQPPLRGFMSAPAAMQDAMHDLVGHGIGTMAGMRAALAGVLERFQPQQLEAKLADKSVLDSLLAMNRKAKLWDLYRQHFDAIRGEAQDDFHTLFGKAFVAAYEEQLDRLPQRSDAA